MSKKDKMADESPRRRYVSYSPLQRDRFLRGGVPALFTMNFPFIESRNESRFIAYTRFRRSYKLSVESIRPLQPNTRVVYATFSYCFTLPMQNETGKADKVPRMVILLLIPKLIELRKRLALESTPGVSHNQRLQTAYLSC